MNNNPGLMQSGSVPPQQQGALGGNQGASNNAMGMNPMMMNQMMMQRMAMQQMQQQRSAMNMGQYAANAAANQNQNQNQNQNNNAMNPMMMQQMAAMQQMAKMQQMAYQQQQQQQQQQHQQQAVKNKKLAGISPVAAKSPKAMELQKLQMEKMKQAMENQMNDLQRTGRSALSSDHYQIESILTLFGISQETLTIIIDNFTKNNIKDKDLKNLDLNDEKLLKKLIPNFKDNNLDSVRKRFITWIRYDIKQLHIHENSELDEKKQDLNDSVITLNISGTKYTTLKSTLLKTGSTYFQRIFSDINDKDNNILLDSDNNYFIDRNGRIFEPILRYLQTKQLYIKLNDWYDINDVLNEMRYYDIQLPPQYDDNTNEKWLPNEFRFEYCCMYNQLRQFFASQFRILPKINSNSITKKIGDFPKDCRDIETFLEIKQKITNLGYQLKDTQVFRGEPSQWVWTYVEFYQRIKWGQK